LTFTGLGFGISLILAALEVFGVIHIGWWLVAAPFLAALGITLVLWLFGFLVGLLILAIGVWSNK
jgi:hypothetical protein